VANVLVLGANGFIGSHLVDSLIREGHQVRAFDRFSSGKLQFNEHKNIEVMRANYLSIEDLKKAIDGIDYIFHFISTTTPVTAEDDPSIDIDTNIKMSVELFKLCKDSRVKKIIFASTGGAIYGNTDQDTPFKETDTPYPISPYAIGKLTIEHYLRYFRVKQGLDSIVLRISNPYGERQPFHRKQGVIPIFLENIARDLPITVFGDGSMVRDYIYVKDLTNAIVAMFEKQSLYNTYNLGSGKGTDINTIIAVAKEVSSKEIMAESRDTPSTFVQKSLLDTSRFEQEFGVAAITSLNEGMGVTYQYIKNEIARS